MNTVCGALAEKEKERQHVLDMMKSGVDNKNSKAKKTSDDKDVELNEWEKKLKEIEKG